MEPMNMGLVERAYGTTFKSVLWVIKPIKKMFVKTLCEVHIFINNQAFKILKNDGFVEEYDFFYKNKKSINEGAVWADQDFRSREHFYNPYTHKGLYGCKSSKQKFINYYECALVHWDAGDKEKAFFYLGAALHLIQDSTIPQHGSVNLLKSHRQFEQWIIDVHDDFDYYAVESGGLYYTNPYEYIEKNSKRAVEAFRRYSPIKNDKDKYYKIATIILPLAQQSTAGCLHNFYQKINE
jgi:phospholipase C